MSQAVSTRLKEFALYTATAPWKLYVKPFKVAPRTYYVGNEWVGIYLIDSEAGLILIDTGVYENVYLTLEGIRSLGFDPKELKHILLTHCHVDHSGGAKALRELTGAKIWLSKIDADFRTTKANLEGIKSMDIKIEMPEFQNHYYEVDELYNDNEPMVFGSVEITSKLSPGHTPGTTSFFIKSADESGKVIVAAIHGGVGPLTMTDKFLKTYDLPMDTRETFIHDCREMKKITVDITLPSHPSHGKLFECITADRMDYTVFIDRDSWGEFLDDRVKIVEELDAKEKNGGA
ncbi:MBL fold metallo-hydrolase [Alkalibaculum sp. M08DMB]|uniref:MBL fold metallo-hydrolase n=1 Tax=Alkalibaculum sporogenes TaxID=2655001 RepID=A0A6A7K9J1_9FIRM|nr:MBL fold metallo-hydrolase [Alkalibaculum sporogenes]MPW26120.1 MBL fold metallo-hydrolase [Alkalibaculum sporogenes]